MKAKLKGLRDKLLHGHETISADKPHTSPSKPGVALADEVEGKRGEGGIIGDASLAGEEGAAGAPVATALGAAELSHIGAPPPSTTPPPPPAVPSSSTISTVWEGAKTILRLVKEAADAFPPLKSTAGGLLGLIDLFEVSPVL